MHLTASLKALPHTRPMGLRRPNCNRIGAGGRCFLLGDLCRAPAFYTQTRGAEKARRLPHSCGQLCRATHLHHEQSFTSKRSRSFSIVFLQEGTREEGTQQATVLLGAGPGPPNPFPSGQDPSNLFPSDPSPPNPHPSGQAPSSLFPSGHTLLPSPFPSGQDPPKPLPLRSGAPRPLPLRPKPPPLTSPPPGSHPLSPPKT